MLLVKTRIGPSEIDGIGLFAAEFIPKGTVVWKFIPGVDKRLRRTRVENLPEAAKKQILKYAYLDEGDFYVMCMDDARHFNHSKSPNTANPPAEPGKDEVTIASEDIYEDDEITSDYYEFDGDAEAKLG